MSKSRKPNPGFPSSSTQGQKFKPSTKPNNSSISKYFSKPPNSQTEEHINKQKNPKNINVTLSDDDVDFESPKKQKKKIIKWELTKTKVYSKKSNKNKKPLTNSTIKIIEDNFKDLDVNPEHLQMGILLSKSEYEANQKNSQPPLEETPDVYALTAGNILTGTILDRFGFKSDKPITRPTFNVPEKSKKRKFRYTTPILVARTEADRDSLLTANISLILSKNDGIRNPRKSETQCVLFSEVLKKLWCQEKRIFCLDRIYETERFTVGNLNLPLKRAHCGFLLREWNSIPAISEESAAENVETYNQQDLTVDKTDLKRSKSDIDSFSIDKLNASNIEIPEEIQNVLELQNLEVNRSKIDNSRYTDSDLLIKITPDNMVLQNIETSHEIVKIRSLRDSPVKKIAKFKRSISPDLFDSDNDLSFTKCDNNSDTFKDSLTLRDSKYDNIECVNSSICMNPKTHNDSDNGVICIDDDDDDESAILNSITKEGSKSVNQKTKYSFDDDEAISLSNIHIVNIKKDNVCKYNFDLDLNNPLEEYCGLKVAETHINSVETEHLKIKSDKPTQCMNKDFNKGSLSNKLDNSSILNNSAQEDDVSFKETLNRKSESFKFSVNEIDSSYNNLNVTDYISNMLDSQDEHFTSDNNLGTVNIGLENKNNEFYDKVDSLYQKVDEKDKSYNIKGDSSTSIEISDPITDDIYQLVDNFSQVSQSCNFIAELNKTDFFNVPPTDTGKISRNSSGESGFWSEGREPETVDIFEYDITAYRKNVDLSNKPNESVQDISQPLTDFVTPDKIKNTNMLNNMIIKTNNVTPMQDYDSMNTPAIRKELDKYGIKPLKRTRGATLLKHIYESTHPYVADCIQESDEENRAVKKRKNIELFPSLATAGGIEIVGDLLLQNEPMEDLIFERKQSAKIRSCLVPLQIVWHNFVTSNPKLKENILLYKPLELEILHQSLKEMGYKFHIQDLLTFLDKKCITVRIKR